MAPALFSQLGVDVRCIGCEPDGRNINLGCGSTPELLARTVVSGGYRIGIAHDGDGDRAIFVDRNGQIVDGDAVIVMCAKQMKREGRLKGDAVVATVMSNIGLEIALRADQIETIRCPVGDKYVMEEMIQRNLSLGGEQSGHVIFSDYLFTGDGLATSLNVLRTMAVSGRELDDLASDLTRYPQVLLNLRVDRKVDLQSIPPVASMLASVESRLAGDGRLLVRYSGTEPLLRVMLEGQDEAQIRRWGRRSSTRCDSTWVRRSNGPSIRQRQQGRDDSQFARWQRAIGHRGRERLRRGGRSGHHGPSARRCAASRHRTCGNRAVSHIAPRTSGIQHRR